MIQYKNLCGGNFLYNHKTNARGTFFFPTLSITKILLCLELYLAAKLRRMGDQGGVKMRSGLNKMANPILGCPV